MVKDRSLRRTLAVLSASLMAGALVFVAATQKGCSPSRCDFNAREPNKPVSSIQCPSGDVCYQGDCRRACEPGREGAMPCNSDSDCSGTALPFCVVSTIQMGASFCSSCDTTDTCVPEIGICQPVVDIPLPDPPGPPGTDTPPLPLDGGRIDGASLRADAEPQIVELTHIGVIALEQVTDFTMGARRDYPLAFADFRDVRTGTVVDQILITNADQCELIIQRTLVNSTPADVGTIRLSSDPNNQTPDTTRRALAQDVNAAFNMGAYNVMPTPLPLDLIFLSDIDYSSMNCMTMTQDCGSQYIQIFSPGFFGATRQWPSQPIPYHIPFMLEPDQESIDLLSMPIVIQSPAQDLEFSWRGVPTSLGAVGGESVRVEISAPGDPFALRCQEFEGLPQSRDNIRVPSAMIDRYKMEAMIAPGAERLIVFERVLAQSLAIEGYVPPVQDAGTPDTGGPTFVEGSLFISHKFVGVIRF